MKAFQWLQALSPAERKQLLARLEKHPRPGLLLLCHSLLADLKSQSAKPDKQKAFREIWKRPYQAKEDYLLRNEARLLLDQIQQFAAETEFARELEQRKGLQESWSLKFLHRKGQDALFDLEFRKAHKRLQSWQVPEEMCQILELKFLQLTQKSEGGLPDTHEKMKWTGALLQQGQLRSIHSLRRYEIYQKYAHFLGKQQGVETGIPPLQHNLELSQPEDPYASYLECRARIWNASGTEKLNIWKEALIHLDRCQNQNVDLVTERIIILTNLALEYFLIDKIQKADEWYQQLFRYAQSKKRSIQTGVWFNYYSNLIRLDAFGRALEVFEEKKEDFRSNELFWAKALCLKGMCHIFRGEGRLALATVPYDFQRYAEVQANYFRIILSLGHYLKGDLDTALREIHNFVQTLNYREKHILKTRPVALFLRRFLSLEEVAADKRPRSRAKLKADLQAYLQDERPEILKAYLPLLWLQKALGLADQASR